MTEDIDLKKHCIGTGTYRGFLLFWFTISFLIFCFMTLYHRFRMADPELVFFYLHCFYFLIFFPTYVLLWIKDRLFLPLLSYTLLIFSILFEGLTIFLFFTETIDFSILFGLSTYGANVVFSFLLVRLMKREDYNKKVEKFNPFNQGDAESYLFDYTKAHLVV
eukprot:TRINITY_DN4092_c0_g1_i1.p1 TRINITY_DN4092_c0_g1~~TRINITY_DN4092_c0_g1_i1.p1  ORF type:complete len:175 (+),score=31.85 TRINITY_DN4092_c0_g1_i1:39-527(+)